MSSPLGPEDLPPPPSAGLPVVPPEVVAAFQQEAAKRLNAAAAAGQAAAEPLSPLDSSCITLRVWFEALVKAGFSDEQALFFLHLKSST